MTKKKKVVFAGLLGIAILLTGIQFIRSAIPEKPVTGDLEAPAEVKAIFKRACLIAFKAIRSVEHDFSRKLSVSLKVPVPEKLLVGKDKASQFLAWLDR
jgi:hypothetical protein